VPRVRPARAASLQSRCIAFRELVAGKSIQREVAVRLDGSRRVGMIGVVLVATGVVQVVGVVVIIVGLVCYG
jgi:hypothetical protein